jgi:hypothetical protein
MYESPETPSSAFVSSRAKGTWAMSVVYHIPSQTPECNLPSAENGTSILNEPNRASTQEIKTFHCSASTFQVESMLATTDKGVEVSAFAGASLSS